MLAELQGLILLSERRTKAGRDIMYHGTTGKFLRSILKVGLQPNTKQKVWDEDPNAGFGQVSRVSYGGVYFGQNLMTAKSSGTSAVRKLGGDFSILITALIQPRSALPDEDTFTGAIESARTTALSRGGRVLGDHETILVEAYLQYALNNTKETDTYLAPFMEYLKNWFSEIWPISLKDEAKIKETMEALLKASMYRKVSHIEERFFKEGTVDSIFNSVLTDVGLGDKEIEKQNLLGRPSDWKDPLKKARATYSHLLKPPSKSESEKIFMREVDNLMKFLRRQTLQKDDINKTYRMMTPVDYKGRNRILSVVSIHLNDDYKKPTILRVHFGKLPSDFLKQWKSRIGSNFVIE